MASRYYPSPQKTSKRNRCPVILRNWFRKRVSSKPQICRRSSFGVSRCSTTGFLRVSGVLSPLQELHRCIHNYPVSDLKTVRTGIWLQQYPLESDHTVHPCCSRNDEHRRSLRALAGPDTVGWDDTNPPVG